MKDLLLFAVMPGIALAILLCLRRAWFLLAHWESVAAIVFRDNFEEASQSWRSRLNDDGGVTIDEVVRFADRQGRYHNAEIQRTVSRWWAREGAYMVWYDPADPARVTANGPAAMLKLTVMLGFAMCMAASAWFDLS